MNFLERKINEEKFLTEYNQLNETQRAAVEEINGAVIVIAGPGTGKTTLLALRVCNILLKTDAIPQNIVCLTFTEAGAMAMRNKLLKIMGSDAHLVNIFTYHGFCNKVIRENNEYFGQLRELSNADDLDQMEVILELMDMIPIDNPIKRNIGNLDYDWRRFKDLFLTMKKEGWTTEDIERAANIDLENFKKDSSNYYSKATGNFVKGDFKINNYEKFERKLAFALEGSKFFKLYNELLLKRSKIDFDDTIRLVTEEFRKNIDVKLRYQEQYQYILADEYQDTNGAQNEILFELADYEAPNIFAVGDDDQSIFRFQGANMYNIKTFINKFHPVEFVLDTNYRSHQYILDAASKLIKHNSERLLEKNLKQGRNYDLSTAQKPILLKFKDSTAEKIGIIRKIEKLHEDGVAYNDIAILYTKHKEVTEIVKYFSKKNVPLKVKKKVNILTQPDVRKLMTLMKYVSHEYEYADSQRSALFELLHYDCFNLNPLDIGKLCIYGSRLQDDENNFLSWRDIMKDEKRLKEIGVSDFEGFLRVHKILEGLIKSCANDTTQVTFEKILTNTKLMEEILASGEISWRLQLINRLFDYIKDQTARNGNLKFKDILLLLEKQEENELEINVNNIVSNSDGINFITAFSAKGLEFKHVFIINATNEGWLKSGGRSNYTLPASLTESEEAFDEEQEKRRLFYVALTRAETNCYITFPKETIDGKATNTLKFLSELGFEDIEEKEEEVIDESLLQDYVTTIATLEQKAPQLIDHNIIDEVLSTLKMNPTGVNKYLLCQIKFYFENILRVPAARLPLPGYGNALHYALDKFSRELEQNPKREMPPVSTLLFYFEKGMQFYKSHFNDKEFELYLYEGKETLKQYYESSISSWRLPLANKTEYRIEGKVDEVPITGIIDRIAIFEDHIDVYDYKTGKGNKTKQSLDGKSLGGDEYWRQAVFYKILLDQDVHFKNSRLNKANIVFLKKDIDDKLVQYDIGDAAVNVVKEQIIRAHTGIKNHEFDKGCNDCEWCTFVNETMGIDKIITDDLTEFEEEDDDIALDFQALM